MKRNSDRDMLPIRNWDMTSFETQTRDMHAPLTGPLWGSKEVGVKLVVILVCTKRSLVQTNRYSASS